MTMTVAGEQHSWQASGKELRWALAEVLGALDLFGLQGKPIKRASAQRAVKQRAVIERGASIVIHAEHEIPALLDRLRVPSLPGQEVQLIHEALPGLNRLLRSQLKGPVRDWLMQQIDEYVARLDPATPLIHRFRGRHAGSTGVSCLVKRVGVRFERVPALLAGCGLTVPSRRSRTGRKMLVVSEAMVASVRHHLNDHSPARVVQRRLGISAARLEHLADAHLIRRTGRRYSVSSVEELLRRVAALGRDHARSDLATTPGQCSLSRALRLHVPRQRTVDFFNELLAGRFGISSHAEQPKCSSEIFVDEAAVRAWQQATRQSDDGMLIPHAAKEMGLKQEVVYHLVKVGLLKTASRVVGRRLARVISHEDLDRFRSEMSPLSVIAVAHGIDFRSSRRWATQLGFEFVSGPGVDGGRQYFVRMPWPRSRSAVNV